MRPLVLFAALLWLGGFLAQEDECPSLEGGPGGKSRGPPPAVNVSGQGTSASLALSWAAPGPGSASHTLRLTQLSPLGFPEGQQLQTHTNAFSFEFQDLVPGSHYQLEVMALHPRGQSTTVALTAHTGAWPAGRGGAAGTEVDTLEGQGTGCQVSRSV